jgi:NitT/TauT family transport system permease protein
MSSDPAAHATSLHGRRKPSTWKRLMLLSPFWSLFFWAALWELIGQMGWNDLIPPLSATWFAILDLFDSAQFWDALWLTSRTFLIGLGLAIVIGIPVGIMMGLSRRADKLLSVWVNLFLSAPLTAVVPALMPLLGIGEATVIATVFLFAVWVVIIDSQAGVSHVAPSLVEMGRVFGCSRRRIIFQIVVPAALPEIITGVRLAVIRAVKGVIVGQIIIALIGFGGLFDTYLSMFLMERFWALIIVIFALSFTLIGLVEMLERRFAFYAGTR